MIQSADSDLGQLEPALADTKVDNGYLLLPSSYTAQHKQFTIDIKGFEPRYISPHPYTNQNTLTLARGPIVYCVEDADNEWESDHFRNIVVSEDSLVTEVEREIAGERYVELRSPGWPRNLDSWKVKQAGSEPGAKSTSGTLSEEKELVFVPYYLRANRDGKGHMRVGLLKK